MKTNDQIAEKAWSDICDLTSARNGKTSDFVAIIKSAIEEALEAQPQGMMSGGVAKMDADRAAQGSEK